MGSHLDPATFRVCGRDLSHIIGRMMTTRAAEDLTTLARHLIQDRLESGPARSAAIVHSVSDRDRVRLWDPTDAWHAGDRALFSLPVVRNGQRALAPCAGEVMQVRGRTVVVRLDGESGTRIYGSAPASGDTVSVVEWRQSVEDLIRTLPDCDSVEAHVDYVLWSLGGSILTALLSVLRQDGRFIALDGRWFLRSVAVVPSDQQLEGLAFAVVTVADRPLTVAEMLPLLPAPSSQGDAGLFGLALGLSQRPDLFLNIDAETRPRYSLVAPPPGDYIARNAAFDPQTYGLLCEVGDTLTPETVQRLWELGLLSTVIERRSPVIAP